jgi:hypothetical protein
MSTAQWWDNHVQQQAFFSANNGHTCGNLPDASRVLQSIVLGRHALTVNNEELEETMALNQ